MPAPYVPALPDVGGVLRRQSERPGCRGQLAANLITFGQAALVFIDVRLGDCGWKGHRQGMRSASRAGAAPLRRHFRLFSRSADGFYLGFGGGRTGQRRGGTTELVGGARDRTRLVGPRPASADRSCSPSCRCQRRLPSLLAGSMATETVIFTPVPPGDAGDRSAAARNAQQSRTEAP
jgi:hypothetical protein